jgi:hypothetical protein
VSDTRLTVTRRVAAPASTIFGIVSSPQGHVDIDGSGMLQATADAAPLTAVGDTFVMDMDREPLGDLPMGKYQILNTVTDIVPDALVEWSVSLVGRDTPVGHVYGWQIEPVSDTECNVSNYCDWSRLPPEYQSRWPIVPAHMLETSVKNLDRLATRT